MDVELDLPHHAGCYWVPDGLILACRNDSNDEEMEHKPLRSETPDGKPDSKRQK